MNISKLTLLHIFDIRPIIPLVMSKSAPSGIPIIIDPSGAVIFGTSPLNTDMTSSPIPVILEAALVMDVAIVDAAALISVTIALDANTGDDRSILALDTTSLSLLDNTPTAVSRSASEDISISENLLSASISASLIVFNCIVSSAKSSLNDIGSNILLAFCDTNAFCLFNRLTLLLEAASFPELDVANVLLIVALGDDAVLSVIISDTDAPDALAADSFPSVVACV